MAEKRFQRLSFEAGMMFGENDGFWLPEGAVDSLHNLVPGRDGGARYRPAWFRGTQTGTAPTDVESIFFSPLAGNAGGIFTSEKTVNAGPSNDIEIRRADNYQTPTWTLIDTLAGAAAGSYCHHVPFVAANGIVLYGNRSFPSDRLRFYNGAAAADASTVAVAGRTLAFFAERFWSGGTDANPDRLYYSAVGDHTSWDLNNYLPIGSNDGGNIMDAVPVLGGLLIAKSTRLYFLTGTTVTNFSVAPLDGGEGAAGRCITFTSKGAIIAGSSGIYIWNGGNVDRIPYNWIYVDPSDVFPVSCKSLGPNVYIMSTFQNAMECLDVERGVRWIESHNVPGFSGEPDLFHFDGTDYVAVLETAGLLAGWDQEDLIGGAKNGATLSGVLFRNTIRPGGSLDDAVSMRTHLEKDHVRLGDAAHPATLEAIHVQLVGPDAAGGDLTVFASAEAASQVTITVPKDSAQRYRVPIGLTGWDFRIFFEQQAPTAANQMFSYPEIVLEYEVQELRG